MIKRLQEKQQHDAAAAQMETAIRLGPELWEVNKDAGRFYLSPPRPRARRAPLREGRGAHGNRLPCLGDAFQLPWRAGGKEKLGEAAAKMVSEAEKAIQQDPSNGAALGILAGGYALLGDEERAREWIARAMLIDPDNLNMRYNFACVLASHLGDKEAAIAILQRTLPIASAFQVKIAATDTDLDILRDDPRFLKLLVDAKKRLGIEDETAAPVASAPAADRQDRAPWLAGRSFSEGWRRGWDSNPRYGCPYAAFRVRCFRPLSHLSAKGAPGRGRRLGRSAAL